MRTCLSLRNCGKTRNNGRENNALTRVRSDFYPLEGRLGPFSMTKRFFSALFILILAGSVWAGVCGCAGGGGAKMKCCKKSSAQKAMGKKRCCGSVCGTETRQGSSIVSSEKGWRFSADEEALELPEISKYGAFQPAAEPFVAPGSSLYVALPRANPPDLTVLNRTFRL